MSTQEECKIRKLSESATIQDAAKILVENPCGGPILVTKDASDEIVGMVDVMGIIKAISLGKFDSDNKVTTVTSDQFVRLGNGTNIEDLITQIREDDDKQNTFRSIVENGKVIGGVYLMK